MDSHCCQDSGRGRPRLVRKLFSKLRPRRRRQKDRDGDCIEEEEGHSGGRKSRTHNVDSGRKPEGGGRSRKANPADSGGAVVASNGKVKERRADGGSKREVEKRPKFWRRLFSRGGRNGRRGGGDLGNYDLGDWEAQAYLLDQLREQVAAHPENLERRAKAVSHDLNDATLSRFLQMGYWTLEAEGNPLAEAIDRTLRWREKEQPHLITDQDVIDEAASGKIYTRGHDREGRALIYYTPGQEMTFDVEKGLQLLFYTMERAVASLPKGQVQFAVVADCTGFGPSKVPPLSMIKDAFTAMQHHYPMRLGYVMIINASTPITLAWKLISRVLHPRTHEKIIFLTPKEAAAKLNEHIDPETLPSTLPGGRDTFRYSNKAYFSA